jgi:hypothetical protein
MRLDGECLLCDQALQPKEVVDMAGDGGDDE